MQQPPSVICRSRLFGRNFRRFVLPVVVLCLLWAFPGCSGKNEKGVAEKVVNVRTAPVEKRSLKPFIESVGTLKPGEEVLVSSQIDGILKALFVQEGSLVTKGMPLARIDDTDYRLELSRAEAAQRQMEASLSNLKAEFERKDALHKEGLVSRQQYDDVVTRRLLAEGEAARAGGALDLAAEKLTRTKISSPMAGAVREKKVTPGDYVRNGTPLLYLTLNNPIKLSFTVTEKDVARLKIGQECLFRVDAFPGREFKGKLHVIYPNLEEKTRTLQVEALVSNPGMLLKPGLFARVMLYTGDAAEKALAPVTALLYETNKIKVFVVEGDRAKERFVRIGGKYGEYAEIVEGLNGGEQLVVVGQNNLAEGVKVHVAR